LKALLPVGLKPDGLSQPLLQGVDFHLEFSAASEMGRGLAFQGLKGVGVLLHENAECREFRRSTPSAFGLLGHVGEPRSYCKSQRLPARKSSLWALFGGFPDGVARGLHVREGDCFPEANSLAAAGNRLAFETQVLPPGHGPNELRDWDSSLGQNRNDFPLRAERAGNGEN